ncbi:MAG TPA: hypothetical protein VMH81_37550 [Bryobacteraceae bacterium]|nr:hypothetical protein [Bryobacteraceae bacterium]
MVGDSNVGRKEDPLYDPDVITIMVLLLLVVVALLLPPGPGSPLPSPVRQ